MYICASILESCFTACCVKHEFCFAVANEVLPV